jgi:hypothetical protein
VGAYGTASGAHGFLLSKGAFTTIDVPGASYTEARGINPKAVSWGSTLSPEAFAMAFC